MSYTQSLGFLPVFGPPKAQQAAGLLLGFIKQNRAAVRRYLVKYGSEDRGFFGSTSKGTSFRVSPRGPLIDLRSSVVNKDNDNVLAGKVAATVFHDAVHAARMAAAVGLGLGSYGVGLGEPFTAIITLLTALGPSLIQLIGGLLQPPKSDEAGAASGGAAAGGAAAGGGYLLPSGGGYAPPREEEKKGISPALIAVGAIAALGVVALVVTRK